MHRLLVDTASLECDRPELPKAEANHLKVVRPKPGERIELFDGRGRWRVYEVEGRGGDGRWNVRAAQPLNRSTSRLPDLTLFACITKGARWDWTIEKTTELGVTRIVPVISERTIVRLESGERESKRERWLRIAEEAARQSDAKFIPEITAPVDFADSLALVRETRCFVGALTDPPPPPLLDAILQPPISHLRPPTSDLRPPTSFAAFIGPEGDFTPAELAALLEIAEPVSLGPTILRAETAAIHAVSVLAAAARRRPA